MDSKDIKEILKQLQKGQEKLTEGQGQIAAEQAKLSQGQDRLAKDQASLLQSQSAISERLDRLETTDAKIIAELFNLKDRIELIEGNFMTREHYSNIMEALDALFSKVDDAEVETAAQNAQLDRHGATLEQHRSRIVRLERATT